MRERRNVFKCFPSALLGKADRIEQAEKVVGAIEGKVGGMKKKEPDGILAEEGARQESPRGKTKKQAYP